MISSALGISPYRQDPFYLGIRLSVGNAAGTLALMLHNISGKLEPVLPQRQIYFKFISQLFKCDENTIPEDLNKILLVGQAAHPEWDQEQVLKWLHKFSSLSNSLYKGRNLSNRTLLGLERDLRLLRDASIEVYETSHHPHSIVD
jgi:hypothetical protein